MKKTIGLIMVSLLILSLSVLGTEVSVPYEDWGCRWEEQCQNEWRCHGMPPHRVCGWEQECHNEYVCDTKDKETSVDVPVYDDTEVKGSITELQGRGDSTGISKCDVWKYLTGEIKYDSCMMTGYSFLDYLKPTFDKLDKVYVAVFGKQSVNGWESGLQDDVRELKAEVAQLRQQCNN